MSRKLSGQMIFFLREKRGQMKLLHPLPPFKRFRVTNISISSSLVTFKKSSEHNKRINISNWTHTIPLKRGGARKKATCSLRVLANSYLHPDLPIAHH
uniref:Uncharacterized protein n=1 Tax=Arundo donax TaxID=35708 RepID=A0A0A9D6Q4_ARUDO